MQIGATPDDRSAVASRAAALLQRISDHPRACGELGTNLTPRCSFSAIVQILKSLTDFPDSGVDDLEPFRTAGDQRVKSLALLHTLADPLILLARRGTVAVTGSARNQSCDLVQVALIDRRVEPEHQTPSTQPCACPRGSHVG